MPLPERTSATEQTTAGARLFHLGLALGLSHLAVSLELAVCMSNQPALVQTLVLFVYPVAFALLGAGGAAQHSWLRAVHIDLPMRAAGGTLALFLIAALRTAFTVGDSPFELVGVFSTLALWFFFLGAAIGRALSHDHDRVGRSWAMHLLGLVAGYASCALSISLCGANALLAAVSLSFLFRLRRGPALLALLLGLCWLVPVDRGLESLRNLDIRPEGAEPGETNLLHQGRLLVSGKEAETVWIKWSHLSQFRLVEASAINHPYVGFYNLRLQWPTRGKESSRAPMDHIRGALYGLIPEDGKVIILGVGGGRGVAELPALHKGITAVDRDPSAIELFRDIHPEWNDRVYEKVNAIAEDGRTAVERLAGPYDAVIVESAWYQPLSSLRPATAPFYLYTREATQLNVRRLKPDGLLVMGFAYANGNAPEFLPAQVLKALHDSGTPAMAMLHMQSNLIYISASPSEDRLAEVQAVAESMDFTRWEPPPNPATAGLELTDDTPFAAWAFLTPGQRSTLTGFGGLLSAVCVLLALGMSLWQNRSPTDPDSTVNPLRWMSFFFLIGVSYTCTEFSTFYSYRSFFGDEIETVMLLVASFLAFAAIGSTLSRRLPTWTLHPAVRVATTLAVLLLHQLLMSRIPHELPVAWQRNMVGPLLVIPAGLLMGAFFPLGLSAGPPSWVGRALLGDALGTLAGYGLVYLVLVPHGRDAFAATSVAAYLAAAILLPVRRP